ncbi:formylglycine-generating enzyme family protein, partial [Verrucomicrobia bacterium]|nr:formylglycine-generating enzyme family protein [Verrucomicrobiota bacterium]
MKSLLLAMLIGLMMVGCGEEVQKESVQEEAPKEASFAVKPGENFTVPDLNLTMIWVEPGTFMMGDKGKQHQVKLTNGFYLGKYELTQAQWEKVMGSDPSRFKGADRPVETVRWIEAVSFCNKLTEMEKKAGRVPEGMAYQMPTEAQWEYACRAGTTTAYSWGDAITKTNANYRDSRFKQTRDVGQYAANPWGFHDMHGNVYEWCADWYGDYPSGAVRDPVGPADGSYRVNRGGSWGFTANFARCATRIRFVPASGHGGLGFRLSLR